MVVLATSIKEQTPYTDNLHPQKRHVGISLISGFNTAANLVATRSTWWCVLAFRQIIPGETVKLRTKGDCCVFIVRVRQGGFNYATAYT